MILLVIILVFIVLWYLAWRELIWMFMVDVETRFRYPEVLRYIKKFYGPTLGRRLIRILSPLGCPVTLILVRRRIMRMRGVKEELETAELS